jgi:hypothetical protein
MLMEIKMYSDWIWQNASTLRDLAAVVGVVGTLFGLGIAVWRSRVERRLQREVNAKRTYAGVLRMAFEHPDYAEPEKVLHSDPVHRKRYIWFVSNILNALDEILLSTDDKIWRETSKMLLTPHRPWLGSDEFRMTELATYNDELKDIVAATLTARA